MEMQRMASACRRAYDMELTAAFCVLVVDAVKRAIYAVGLTTLLHEVAVSPPPPPQRDSARYKFDGS